MIMAHLYLMRSRARGSRRGFTLIELMIVVALIMILTAIGIGLSDDLIPRFRTRQAAKTFSSKVNECRALAIRSGKECSVWLLAADSSLTNLDANNGEYWVGMGNKNRDSSTWDYLPVDTETGGSDSDQSQGVIDIGDKDGQFYQRRVGIAQWSSLGGPGTGNSDRIVFGPRGFVTNPSSDFGALGTIDITFVNKVARADGFSEDWTVKVGRTGMTRIDTTVQNEYGGLRSGTAESSSTP
jgi:prepilin-type N-terminal cleavage/methylation domain-containing protein